MDFLFLNYIVPEGGDKSSRGGRREESGGVNGVNKWGQDKHE